MILAFRLINVLMLTAMAGLTVDMLYDSIGIPYAGKETAQLAAREDTTFSRSQILPRDEYKIIVERDLFNVNQPNKPVPQEIVIANLEETSLDAKLWGTVTGINDSRYAVIEIKGADNRRRQVLLREGELIETAVIEKIMRDKVILELNGENQVLMLEKFQLKGRSRYASRTTRRTVNRAPASVRTQRRLIRRNTIEKAASNLGELMAQAKFVSHSDGMRIMSIKPRSIFRRMGLRNGDILTGVDGRSIHSIDDALSIYHGLKNSDELSLKINRRGREHAIKYMIRESRE